VALGGEPTGDKRRQGDERTPEGTFRVTHRNPNSAFHLSLGLSYPDVAHADRGLAEKIIDAATHERVVAADRARKMPVRSTALGGDIYIHGGGPLPNFWTDGCVAITNAQMDWLFAEVGPGTRVRIEP
jgi:murein L,D-transpeptidase YafK